MDLRRYCYRTLRAFVSSWYKTNQQNPVSRHFRLSEKQNVKPKKHSLSTGCKIIQFAKLCELAA